MRAWVLDAPGGPEAFQLREIPRPTPDTDQVLIRVRAFGLNRSEWFTRNGDSPSVQLPRVLGIECVGQVEADPSGELEPGATVAALMGGMGRVTDGGYAEYAAVPRTSVFPLQADMKWSELAALPEMLQTVHGSLHVGLGIQPGDTLLIRGGTSSIGLTTAAMARGEGVRVLATSRSEHKRALLEDQGVEVVIDSGSIAASVRALVPAGVDRVLELIGATTLKDSLRCARPGGVVCMTGILGGAWRLDLEPMVDIPSGVRLTSYSGGAGDITVDRLQGLVVEAASGRLSIARGPVFAFEDLREAHRVMDENRAGGKMVVVVEDGPV